MKRYPFFLVVDDGGRPYLQMESERVPITIRNYELVLELAREFELTIPIAYSFRYLDVQKLSGLSGALDYADELAAFIREHREVLPMYHHGLTHGWDYLVDDGCWTATHAEFFDLDHGRPIPEIDQSSHLKACSAICEVMGLGQPAAFVPPCHAWEPGVTDRLLASHGIARLITVPVVRFAGRTYRAVHSDYVRLLPRRSLHISHNTIGKGLDERRLRTMHRLVSPMNGFWKLRYYRRWREPAVHSYYVHITNFFPESRDFWCRFFDGVRNRKDLVFPRTTEEAEQAFDLVAQ